MFSKIPVSASLLSCNRGGVLSRKARLADSGTAFRMLGVDDSDPVGGVAFGASAATICRLALGEFEFAIDDCSGVVGESIELLFEGEQ